jgi:Tol biopolymer transport system component
MKRIVSIAIALLMSAGITTSAAAQNYGQIEVPDADASGGPLGSVTFHSQRDGNFEIYRMNPDGTDQIRITFDSGADVQPDLSPNGGRIVFVSNRITPDNTEGDNEIFVMNSDGSDVTQLTFNAANEGWPRWSPNGGQIAFHSNRDGNFEIYIINADGSGVTRVTNHQGVDQFPEWSPNGRWLAIRRDHDVSVIGADGENPVQLTTHPAIDQMAAWSPNGRQLAFMSLREGYCSIFLMNADGTDQVNLTPKDPADPPASWCSRAPSWSRSGRQIYFMSFRPSTGGNPEIFVMNADGTDATQLTFAPGEDGFPTVR